MATIKKPPKSLEDAKQFRITLKKGEKKKTLGVVFGKTRGHAAMQAEAMKPGYRAIGAEERYDPTKREKVVQKIGPTGLPPRTFRGVRPTERAAALKEYKKHKKAKSLFDRAMSRMKIGNLAEYHKFGHTMKKMVKKAGPLGAAFALRERRQRRGNNQGS
jgi:hypothetical protein